MTVAPGGRLRSALVVAVLTTLACLGLHTRPFLLQRLVITGLHQASPAEVRAALALPRNTYTWQVRPWTVDRRLRRDPLLASAHASYLWPDGLRIAVVERRPVAALVEGQTAWELDGSGLVLRALPDAAPHGPLEVPGLGIPVPVILGVTGSNPIPGEVLRGQQVARALEVAGGLGGAVGSTVGAITVSASATVGVLTLDGLPVNYGDGADAREKTAILLGVLAALGSQRSSVASIDLASTATPALKLVAGAPPIHLNGVVSG